MRWPRSRLAVGCTPLKLRVEDRVQLVDQLRGAARKRLPRPDPILTPSCLGRPAQPEAILADASLGR
jgi:hypothetical protein